ncbi:MAG TPA: hypothetical protein VG944_05875 [Fimbriimonas sp.]|nr:hypothetical protein [Fimbriimonas sp.]
MLFVPLCLIAATGQRLSTIEVQHVRPSRMLQRMREFYFSNSSPWPFRGVDDRKGVLYVAGSDHVVDETRTIVREFDVAPRKVSVTATIDSAIDKLQYEVTGKINNGQHWTTGDAEVGVGLTFTPRVNPDNTVTLVIDYQLGDGKPERTVCRLKSKTPLEVFKSSEPAPKDVLPIEPKITVEAHVLDQ